MDAREVAKQNVLMQENLFIKYQVSLSSALMLQAHLESHEFFTLHKQLQHHQFFAKGGVQ